MGMERIVGRPLKEWTPAWWLKEVPILHGQGVQRRWNALDAVLDEVLARQVEEAFEGMQRLQWHRHDKAPVEKRST